MRKSDCFHLMAELVKHFESQYLQVLKLLKFLIQQSTKMQQEMTLCQMISNKEYNKVKNSK